jgi:hypothetical protein
MKAVFVLKADEKGKKKSSYVGWQIHVRLGLDPGGSGLRRSGRGLAWNEMVS